MRWILAVLIALTITACADNPIVLENDGEGDQAIETGTSDGTTGPTLPDSTTSTSTTEPTETTAGDDADGDDASGDDGDDGDDPGSGTVLEETMSGNDIEALQEALVAAGFDPGPIDGVFGPDTTSAVMAFQRAVGLPVTGEVDDATLDAIESAESPPETTTTTAESTTTTEASTTSTEATTTTTESTTTTDDDE